MNISSKDIKKRDFKKSLRGYDTNEVDAFLDTVSSHYEKLIAENKTQADKIKSILSDIDIYKENEQNLQRAIIKSQDLGEEIVINAKKKAEMIIKEAELNSVKIRQDVDNEILNKKQELEDIKFRNDKIMDDVRNYLNDKLNELEDFIKNKKVFKMELASLSELSNQIDAHLELPDEQLTEEKKPMKKVFISSQSDNKNKTSFDDSFEVK